MNRLRGRAAGNSNGHRSPPPGPDGRFDAIGLAQAVIRFLRTTASRPSMLTRWPVRYRTAGYSPDDERALDGFAAAGKACGVSSDAAAALSASAISADWPQPGAPPRSPAPDFGPIPPAAPKKNTAKNTATTACGNRIHAARYDGIPYHKAAWNFCTEAARDGWVMATSFKNSSYSQTQVASDPRHRSRRATRRSSSVRLFKSDKSGSGWFEIRTACASRAPSIKLRISRAFAQSVT